ncbi:maleate cis-trans isomerase family protein [Cohnella thailandensis]|uniref:Aspartate/glutamate racemase family protein n=1 Tax=Cohnella thailandensis TaxID=557557 RepID=A0A841T3L6_9BACL|nr:aspartate/glutamate racemase family protein [Cohnella thailandensis]MBB6636650.1 aspartate/glutamate racemase family protein [Cohnella thailandensis]MBP1973474.1 maleate isomerase [Cohnella thailandensis]
MARIGMLTPSSNTVLEPITCRLLEDLPGVTAHFSRIRVTQISLDASSDSQFAESPMLSAAHLLADAKVDALVWNGTSGSWLGLEHDHALCGSIERETGIPATTSALAMKASYELLGVRRLALVTPYTDDVNEKIAQGYRRFGVECAIALGSGLAVNEQFASVAEREIGAMIDEAARAKPDAVAIVCTNMNAAGLAASKEREYGIPMLDSVSVTAWESLRMLKVDAKPLAKRWGRIFEF